MIQKNKTKIVVLISSGVLINVGLSIILLIGGRAYRDLIRRNDYGILSFILAIGILGGALYMWGLVLLAQARGYSGAVVAAAWLGGSLMGCCIPGLGIMGTILPVAILFTLPDKNKVRSRRRAD